VDNGSAEYVGEWMAEKRHGMGTLFRRDGGRYDGSWVDDKQSGSGCERLPGSTYTGQFENGLRHGQGRCIFDDGRACSGEWFEGLWHGDMRVVWADGAAYEGQYQLNKRSGVGQYTWADGRMYHGEWSGSKQHGRGTFTDVEGHVWTGHWRNGRKLTSSEVKAERHAAEVPWPTSEREGYATLRSRSSLSEGPTQSEVGFEAIESISRAGSAEIPEGNPMSHSPSDSSLKVRL
jgi:hypothetical protein